MNFDLTHPEILTIEQLQKFVGFDTISDRDELIQLFYKYIAPLPQRTFRTNHWGIMLTDSQKQFQRENSDLESTSKSILKLPENGFNVQPQGEKHESDRGIYTITMQKSANKNTAPIKLKRPTSNTITNSDNKRMKPDTTNT